MIPLRLGRPSTSFALLNTGLVARLVVTPVHVEGSRDVADNLTESQARAVFASLIKLLGDVAALEPLSVQRNRKKEEKAFRGFAFVHVCAPMQ